MSKKIEAIQYGTVDPTAVTPDSIGQVYLNTTDGSRWVAYSTTEGEWNEQSGTNTGDQTLPVKATGAEVDTGEDDAKFVTPDALAGSNLGIRYVEMTLVDYATALTTGDGKGYFTVPTGLDGMNLVSVHAKVITAGTTGTTDIQIYNVTDSQDMLSTKLTIDTGDTGSDTAETSAVINATYDDISSYDVLRIDVDAISTTAPKGLIVTMGFQLP